VKENISFPVIFHPEEWQNDPPPVRNHLSEQNNGIPDDLNSHQHQNDMLNPLEPELFFLILTHLYIKCE
jgi:hypothetical protein